MKEELATRLQDLYRRAKECMTDVEMGDIDVTVKVDNGDTELTFDEFDIVGETVTVCRNQYGLLCGMVTDVPLNVLSDDIIAEILDQAEIDVERAEQEIEKVFDRNHYSTL